MFVGCLENASIIHSQIKIDISSIVYHHNHGIHHRPGVFK